jgi:predicted thioredoxin/glutaredoxin
MARLDIFVSAHCFGCREARRLAEAVAERFGAVSVRLVDLDAQPDARPERVIAVPAYLLDDEVIALGNPRQADLFRQVERALAAE